MNKKISLEQIKKLRAKTKAGVMDCRQALEEAKGDMAKAENWLKEKGIKSAAKKADRETCFGRIEVYSHGENNLVAVVELLCETDFVAKTKEFKNLAHELAMQVAAMNPKNVDDLLKQSWIRDEKVIISDLIKQTIGKLGENIKVGRILRLKLGEEKS